MNSDNSRSYLADLKRADENMRRDAETDPEPEEEIGEIAAWCADYRARLRAAILPGRNKARNKTVLSVLCLLMEKAGTAVFAASVRYLMLKANCENATVTSAIWELREQGYLRRHSIDPNSRSSRYSLIKEKLPLVDQAKVCTPPLKSAVSGDYSSDAFHNKAMKSNKRLVYEYVVQHHGLTSYAISKAIGQDPKTTKKAIDWLVAEKLVKVDGKKAATVLPLGMRREQEKLIDIAVRNHTLGKGEKRSERCVLGWQQYRAGQHGKTKTVVAATTSDEDLEFTPDWDVRKDA